MLSILNYLVLNSLLGEKIPREKLCANELSPVEMIMPGGDSQKGHMKQKKQSISLEPD